MLLCTRPIIQMGTTEALQGKASYAEGQNRARPPNHAVTLSLLYEGPEVGAVSKYSYSSDNRGDNRPPFTECIVQTRHWTALARLVLTAL